MNEVAQLPVKDRQDLFAETAARMGATPAIAEKDFWVVWVLDKLFRHELLGRILKFKGGTSLSKVFDVIGRFSEDIDLILDWRQVTESNPYEERSKSRQNKFNRAINDQAKDYIATEIVSQISELLAPLCTCHMQGSDGFNIYIRYPSAFSDRYLRAEILLEIGPLAAWTPSDIFIIRPYSAVYFPQIFTIPGCQVSAIVAQRTFWEKATILHQEAHRAAEKVIPPRYSRHYYDMALLARSSIKPTALSDLMLLAEVVAFKQHFYPAAWARYDLAVPGSLKLLPPAQRFSELRRDYQAMRNMIFDKHLSFEEIMDTLEDLENEINSLYMTASYLSGINP